MHFKPWLNTVRGGGGVAPRTPLPMPTPLQFADYTALGSVEKSIAEYEEALQRAVRLAGVRMKIVVSPR